MTDRYFALTVVLERDTRDDDAAGLIAAIGQLRGVLGVEPHVADYTTRAAVQRVREEFGQKVLDMLYPERAKR